MKIIFLDIDGVLNVYPQRNEEYPDGHDEYGARFHEHLVENLKTILDATGAKIVMSSSWRHNGFAAITEMWKFRNLPGEVIDLTPYHKHGAWRGEEIKEYVDNTTLNIESYVILDDDEDMLKEQLSFFVKTSGNTDHTDYVDGGGYGLTKECAQKAIEILNKS